MEKSAKFIIDVSAEAKRISNSSVRFFSKDHRTAKFLIQAEKDKVPIPKDSISRVEILFESVDISYTPTGKVIFNDDMTIEENGLFSYVLPDDLLNYSGLMAFEVYIYYVNEDAADSSNRIIYEQRVSAIDRVAGQVELVYIKDMETAKREITEQAAEITENFLREWNAFESDSTAKMQALDQDVTDLENRTGTLDGTVAGLEGRVDGLKTSLDGLDKRASDLETETGNLESQTESLAKSVTGLENRSGNVESRVSKLETDTAAAITKTSELVQNNQRLDTEMQTLDQNLNELRNDMKLSEAWAWSRDGVDRFTRKIYENLIVNSGNFKTLAPWSGGVLDTTTFSFPTIKGTESLAQPENLTLKSDTEYVAIMRAYFTAGVEISSNFPFHMYVREEGGIPQSGRTYMEIVGGNRKAIPNAWETIIIKFKTIASDKKITFKPHLYHNAWNGAERWLQNVMLVEGNEIPDFWVPNPADDKQNAYPQYRGLALVPSDLPEDYVWEESTERIKQLTQQETDKLKSEVAEISDWIRKQGGTI